MNFFKHTAAALATISAIAIATLATPAAFAAEKAELQPTVGLWVLLDAKSGKEDEVAQFLLGGLAIVEGEPATSTWYAVRLSPSQFAIFDTFPNDAGRGAHLSGKVAAALMAKAPEMLAHPPTIAKVDIMASKLPATH